MKTLLLFFCLFSLSLSICAQEYKVVTIVESIVPAGLGRSRMIDNKTDVNVKDFTTERVNGKESNQDDVKRSNVKVDTFSETKLLNFFSIAGINFQNIASNDAVITSKMNDLVKEGWKLAFVTSGVESDSGVDDGEGIFITRLIFTRAGKGNQEP
ncbi:hypothetical protein GZH53_14005 [Flavihumibacter sp. R14]|nr:hypothetical protein [Flavihumibacter soli]